MQGKTLRQERINELIRQHIGEILIKEVSFRADVIVTTTKVDVQPDLRRVRIGLSVLPETSEGYVFRTLQNEMYRIQGALNLKLATNPLPQVHFYVDKTESHADEVEALLRKIKEETHSSGHNE